MKPKSEDEDSRIKRASIGTLLYVAFHYLFYRILRIFWKPSDNDRAEQPAAAKVVVITGANGGLGQQTAIEMGDRGATIILGCRNLKQGEIARKYIQRVTGSDRLFLMHLDLSDLNSVRTFAHKIQKQFPKVNILINNAGIHTRNDILEYTKDGFETHFGINHLGHFLLTNLLLPNLKNAAPSRIVTVSSTFQILEELNINDLNLKKNGNKSIYGGSNNSNMTYANSKFANSLFMYELGYRLKNTGVTTYSLCPGILNTELHFAQKDQWNWFKKLMNYLKLTLLGFSPKQGVETVLHCALSNHSKNETGLMYHFSKPFESCNKKYNRELSKELWTKSEKMVGEFNT